MRVGHSFNFLILIGNDALFNLVIHAVQRRTLKYDQSRRVGRRAMRERNGEYALGHPRAAVGHVELSLDPNGRAVILGVEREPQAVIERGRIAHMRAKSSKEGARRPSTFVLIVVLVGSTKTGD